MRKHRASSWVAIVLGVMCIATAGVNFFVRRRGPPAGVSIVERKVWDESAVMVNIEASWCVGAGVESLECLSGCRNEFLLYGEGLGHVEVSPPYKVVKQNHSMATVRNTKHRKPCRDLTDDEKYYKTHHREGFEPVKIKLTPLPGATESEASYCIAHLGDWGNATKPASRIAAALARTATAPTNRLWAVISAGDNFYTRGVKSVDDPQFLNTFERQYGVGALRFVPWYPVLGNHDVKQRGSGKAQVAYSNKSWRWDMPGAWYFKEQTLPNGVVVCMGFIDTNNEKGLERKQLKELSGGYHEGCAVRILTGHNPVYSGGAVHGATTGKSTWKAKTARLQAILIPFIKTHHIHMYLSGDDHSLQILNDPPSGASYYVSGASGGTYRFHPARDINNTVWHSTPRQFGWMRHCINATHVTTYVHGAQEVLYTYIREF